MAANSAGSRGGQYSFSRLYNGIRQNVNKINTQKRTQKTEYRYEPARALNLNLTHPSAEILTTGLVLTINGYGSRCISLDDPCI